MVKVRFIIQGLPGGVTGRGNNAGVARSGKGWGNDLGVARGC